MSKGSGFYGDDSMMYPDRQTAARDRSQRLAAILESFPEDALTRVRIHNKLDEPDSVEAAVHKQQRLESFVIGEA